MKDRFKNFQVIHDNGIRVEPDKPPNIIQELKSTMRNKDLLSSSNFFDLFDETKHLNVNKAELQIDFLGS